MLILSNYSNTKQPTTSVCIIMVEKIQVIGRSFYSVSVLTVIKNQPNFSGKPF